MDYNPLTARLHTAKKKIKHLHERRADAVSQLTWAEGFEPEASAADIERLHSDLRIKIDERGRLEAESARLKLTADRLKSKTSALEAKARMGWNPSYWLSDKRSDAKAQLKKHRKKVERHLEGVDGADKERRRVVREVKRLADLVSAKERELARHKDFQPAAVRLEIEKIDEELPFREMERDDLRRRKDDVDRRLKAPLTEMRKYDSEVEVLHQAISELEHDQSNWRRQIAEAERIDRELTRASNAYERAMLHQKCEQQFGKGSPSIVIRDMQFQVRRTQSNIDYNKRQIARIRRDIAKTEGRIKKIAEIASRDVRALMIDGKNCCFEDDQFIGLAALIPLTNDLAKRYDVTVVFDASIRRDLGASDAALRAALPATKVHVVASRAKADETILDAAADPAIWVISNDRFGDYRDKTPVREGRIIRHEILHGRVMVHDLGVDVRFAVKQ
jgi:chromosome segregation ATPase